MATAEQPLKKRKIYEAFPLELDTAPSQQPPGAAAESKDGDETIAARPPTPPPLSQDEILRRRRNQEEIRNVFEIFKTIKRCVSNKDSRFVPELKQAYLSLLTASRGCRSVQRIVSKCIPQYAPYCPTALEAATQVIINIHNWSLPVISRGEDVDGATFEIAMNCITGLVDISCTASSKAAISSVTQCVRSAVFHNILSFFASTLEGKDLFQIIDKEALKMLDSSELFSDIQQNVSSEKGHALLKLSKLRALSFLQIIFCCPKDLLAVCFDLFIAPAMEGCCKEGKYLISQLVNRFNAASEQDTSVAKDMSEESTTGVKVDAERNYDNDERVLPHHDIAKGGVSFDSENCLLGLVLKKHPSLKRWIFSRYKKLSQSASSQSASDIINVLQAIIGSFKDVDNVGDSDEGNSDASNYIGRQHMMRRICDQQNSSSEVLGKDFTSPVYDGSSRDGFSQKISGGYRKHHSSVVPVDRHSSSGMNHGSVGSRSVDFKSNEHGDVCHGRSSMSVDLQSNQLLSPIPRKPLSTNGDNFEAGERSLEVERSQTPKVDATGFSGRLVWFCDGDPAAMDVFSASRQLWVGSLPPEASEHAVRFQLERFGPVESFYFYPVKGFALVEYRSIMDAVKAREYICGCSPWNAPIRVKFMDTALGSSGAVDGVAIGSSCHVYVGNIFSHWMKDDILRETTKVVYRGPRMVTELASEGALLLEFGTPEEAASAMACLRQLRRGTSNFQLCSAGPTDMTRSHSNIPRNMSATTIPGSPQTQTGPESHSGMHIMTPRAMKADGGPEFVSPRAGFEKPVLVQGGPAIQSNWPQPSCVDAPEAGASKCDIYSNSVGGPVPSQGAVPRTSEPTWTYRQPEFEHHSVPGTSSCIPVPVPAPTVAPSPQIQRPPYMPSVPPAYFPPNSSWDPRGFNHPVPYNAPPPGFMPPNVCGGAIPPPFVPASVTPLSQIKGSGTQQYNQMVYQSVVAPPVPSVPPPKPEVPPPLPPSPPPLPPPSSPPPPPPPPDAEPSNMNTAGSSLRIQWQGSLSKSGVHYCTISAHRLESDICKYSIAISEPTDWPVKLDMTKRTDFRHVKSTFSNTQPHRREVCRLLPASSGDQKGFQDFMSYLKQRECAGVIKIPAVNSLWTRLLFILPCSPEARSMLCVTPDPTDCLIALILPKETNLD